jgi:ABC-type polar amino acid transport system ATPase subunit
MVFQDFNLFAHMTALSNIMIGPIKVKKMPKEEARELALYELKRVGLAEKADAYPGSSPAVRNSGLPSPARLQWPLK